MPGTPPHRARYDAAIVGSNLAGMRLATEFARAGARTVLVDCFRETQADSAREPAALVASANMARLARSAAEFGVRTGDIAVDLREVQRLRHQAARAASRGAAIEAARHTPGLEVLAGEPRFAEPDLLCVHEPGGRAHALQAVQFFIDTGSRPVLPLVAGLDRVPFLSAQRALELEELPAHLLVLGGSYQGVEFAQMFRRLGSRVSIVERGGQLLRREDKDVAAAVAESLREDGVEVFLETQAMAVAAGAAGGVQLEARTPCGTHCLGGSHLLVAAAREPNTRGLALSAAGVAVDSRGFVAVDEHLQTSAAGVYALGVVNGGPPFAQVAYDDFRVIRANLLEHASPQATRTCPYIAFSNPALGRVGLTHAQAREQGRRVAVAKLPLSKLDSAVTSAESRGLTKIVVEADTDRILGAAVLGAHSPEVIGMLQIAMMSRMPYAALRDGLAAHPAFAGSLNNLFLAPDAYQPFNKETINEPATVSDGHQGAA